jgi:hypothetical protein
VVNPHYVSTRLTGLHVVNDVVFIVNGIEVLRFSKTSKGDELIAKHKSMGFNTTQKEVYRRIRHRVIFSGITLSD